MAVETLDLITEFLKRKDRTLCPDSLEEITAPTFKRHVKLLIEESDSFLQIDEVKVINESTKRKRTCYKLEYISPDIEKLFSNNSEKYILDSKDVFDISYAEFNDREELLFTNFENATRDLNRVDCLFTNGERDILLKDLIPLKAYFHSNLWYLYFKSEEMHTVLPIQLTLIKELTISTSSFDEIEIVNEKSFVEETIFPKRIYKAKPSKARIKVLYNLRRDFKFHSPPTFSGQKFIEKDKQGSKIVDIEYSNIEEMIEYLKENSHFIEVISSPNNEIQKRLQEDASITIKRIKY